MTTDILSSLRQRGAMFVEFAICLPMFCFLMFGMIYYSLFLHDVATLDESLRASARYGTVMFSGSRGIGEWNMQNNVRKMITENYAPKLMIYSISGTPLVQYDNFYWWETDYKTHYITVTVKMKRNNDIPMIVDSLVPKEYTGTYKLLLEKGDS